MSNTYSLTLTGTELAALSLAIQVAKKFVTPEDRAMIESVERRLMPHPIPPSPSVVPFPRLFGRPKMSDGVSSYSGEGEG